MAFIHVFTLTLISAVAAKEQIVRRERQSDVALHNMSDEEVLDHKGIAASAPASTDEDDVSINTCNDAYPLGVVKTNDCEKPHFDYLILDREMCIEAAREAGVTTLHNKFEVQASGDWRWKHPKGCFKTTCGDTVGHQQGEANSQVAEAGSVAATHNYCYFYNPIGTNPSNANISDGSVPVCYRPKILKGTINSATKATECRDGFEPIALEDPCREAANCLGLCKGQPYFQISQHVNSKFENYPEGCFIEENTGCVYFNKRPGGNWGDDLPSNPVGTPLCNVTHSTLAGDWPSPTPAPTPAP